MKKLAVVVAGMAVLSGLSAEVAAQSSVTVYGVVDTGLVRESGNVAGPVTKLTSGIASGSRIGFKGTEDLGDGLSALFLLETGFQNDTGALGQGGLLFGRQSYVGLGSTTLGTLTAGRQYTSQYNVLAMVDPFSTGLAGDAANLMPNTGNGASRMDNAIKYASPNFGGVTGELMYGFGETAGTTSGQSQIGGAIGYANGPLNVRLGHHYRNNDTSATAQTSGGRSTLLGGTYDFGVLKGHLAYGVNQGVNSSPLRNTANPFGSAIAPTASTDSRDMLIGVTAPFGAHTVLASYIRKDDRTALNQDASQWALGYRYALSKRTDLYAAYARISNKNGAGYTVGSAIEVGSGDSAVNLGIRHAF